MNGILSRAVFLQSKAAAIMLAMILIGGLWSSPVMAANAPKTPIRHLIVVVGENHSFDSLFGIYQPAPGQTIFNLLSEGVVNRDGTPGPHFNKAQQWQAIDDRRYSIAPSRTRPFVQLPRPNTTFAFGQPLGVADLRFPADLANGPFQLSKYSAYQLAYTGDSCTGSSKCGNNSTKAATICLSGMR